MAPERDTAADRGADGAAAPRAQLAGGPGSLGLQNRLAFGPEGQATIVAEPVPRRAPRARGNFRTYKAEQLVEYLGRRGPMPAESLAKVIRGGWRRLAKDLGCSRLEAFKLWAGVCDSLLPFTAARLSQLELKGDPAAGLGLATGAAAHFLAASAVSLLAPANDGEPGAMRDNSTYRAQQTIDGVGLFERLEDAPGGDRRSAEALLSQPAAE